MNAASGRRSSGRFIARCALVAIVAIANAGAQEGTETDSALERLRARLVDVKQKSLANPSSDAIAVLRVEALALRRRSADIAIALRPRLANLDERLEGLGTAPTVQHESAGITAERDLLMAQRSRIDTQLRLARLLEIDSEQTADQIDDIRRARFTARLFERTAPLLDGRFWTQLADAWPETRRRLGELLSDVGASASRAGAGRLLLALLCLGASVSLVPLGLRKLPAAVTRFIPSTRLRRSTMTLAHAVVPACMALSTGILCAALLQGADAPDAVKQLWQVAVTAIAFGIFVATLGLSIFAPSHPTWRLLPLPDAVANRLRHDPLLMGAVIGASVFIDRSIELIHADVGAQIAGNGIVSLMLGVLLVWALRRGEIARRESLGSLDADQSGLRSLWLLAVEGTSWIALATSLACLLLGYIALGTVIVKQVAWLVIVASAAYVLVAFIDDAWSTWLGGRAPAGEATATFTAGEQRVQAAVVLSAFSRIVVISIAAVAMIGPLGQGPAQWVERFGALEEGVSFGDIRVDPGSVGQAVAVLVLGSWAVILTRRWLLDRFFPTTQVDDGMREALATLTSWIGYVAVWALAFSSIGIGVERVTWIVSALSVGIGFGLRAFVQNFLAGLILLTERPMSVGDVVVIEGVEGEIRRINLRTTELELDDHSISLVPNYLFATRIATNITNDRRRGAVQIRLAMPFYVPADLVLAELSIALRNHVEVLPTPEPRAFVEDVEAGCFIFVAKGTIETPRRAHAVKSELIKEIFDRLKTHGIDLKESSAVMTGLGSPLGFERPNVTEARLPASFGPLHSTVASADSSGTR